MSRAGRLRGFTWIELLVLIAIIAMLTLFMLPARNERKRRLRFSIASTHTRWIHQGELLFAESNNGWFAGFDRDGKLDIAHVFAGAPQSTDWNGYDQSTPRAPAWRLRRLLESDYFPVDLRVSPSETRAPWQPGEAMDPSKFSYAMLKIEGEADSPRKREHRKTDNPQAIVLSTRAIKNGSGYRSVHTNPKSNTVYWIGSVCWNDNHVTFEPTAVLDTTYDQTANKADDLFTDSNPSGVPNAEAAMAWKSAGDTDAELME